VTILLRYRCKKQGSSGRSIGNAHLEWAFSEAAALVIRSSPEAKAFMETMTRQRGKARAVKLVVATIGRFEFGAVV